MNLQLKKIKYAIVMPDEDGETVSFLTEEELYKTLDDPQGERSIEDFLSEDDEVDGNVQYWPEGLAALFEVKLLTPEVTKTAFRLPK